MPCICSIGLTRQLKVEPQGAPQVAPQEPLRETWFLFPMLRVPPTPLTLLQTITMTGKSIGTGLRVVSRSRRFVAVVPKTTTTTLSMSTTRLVVAISHSRIRLITVEAAFQTTPVVAAQAKTSSSTTTRLSNASATFKNARRRSS